MRFDQPEYSRSRGGNDGIGMKILKWIIPAIFIFTCAVCQANPILQKVRADFYEIVQNSDRTAEVLSDIRDIENPNAVIKAYEAAVEAMMARVVWNPFSKLKHVRKSQQIFNEAFQMDSLNVELRFVRFAVEYNIPKWLGYSKNMQDDRDFIMAHLYEFDLTCITEEMLGYIKGFLEKSGWYSSNELEEINALEIG